MVKSVVKTFCRCFFEKGNTRKSQSFTHFRKRKSGFRAFEKSRSESCLHAPKRRALPTAPHPEINAKYKVQSAKLLFIFSVSGQICSQTTYYEDFAREHSAEKVNVYKNVSSMFARTFKVLLFSAKRSFARGGVPAGVLLPNIARYQLRYIPIKYTIVL